MSVCAHVELKYDLIAGDDCSQIAHKGYWEMVESKGFLPVGSASHEAVVFRDSMYIIGGESYKRGKMTYIYDFTGNVWETLHMDNKPFPTGRYGHSAVLFGVRIKYIFILIVLYFIKHLQKIIDLENNKCVGVLLHELCVNFPKLS